MKISTSPFLQIFLLAVGLLWLVSCEKDPKLPFPVSDPSSALNDSLKVNIDSFMVHLDSIQNIRCRDLADFFLNLPKYGTPAPADKMITGSSVDTSGGIICTTKTVTWAPTFDIMNLTSPLGSLQPGQMYDGNSFGTGAYRLIQAKRDSIRISVSLPTLPGADAGIWIKDPHSIADVRNGINTLLNRVVPGATPAYINFEINQVQALEEVDLHLGANFSGWGAKIKGSYDFNQSSHQTKLLVRFQQIYYTIDVDPILTPCQLFNPIPTVQEAENLFKNSSPVYVASVQYGRAVYYMVESDSSVQKVKKALDLSFSRWGANLEANLSHEDQATIVNSSIRALIVGGNADGAVKSINGLDDLRSFITEGGDFSANDNIGVPLSYRMKFVYDGSDAKIVLASSYQVRNCEAYKEEITLTYSNANPLPYYCAVHDGNGDDEFEGHGPLVEGDFTLIHENGEISILVHCTWKEQADDWTSGVLDLKIHIESIPIDKEFAGFSEETKAHFSYTDMDHMLDNPPLSGGEFISDLSVMGDSDGDDLACEPDGQDANIRFKINPIKVLVRLK